MPVKCLINNPEHWLYRAHEARANAGAATDQDAERILLEIARGYDQLAKRARTRALGEKDPLPYEY